MDSLGECALKYLDQGWSVFPLGVMSKRPHFELLKRARLVNERGNGSWTPFTQKRASEELIRDFWKKVPNANIGLACGQVSGITVVDIDWKENEPTWIDPEVVESKLGIETLASRTGGGGIHLFCQYEHNVPNSSDKQIHPQIDIKNNGGYVVLPPSIHDRTGLPYSWKNNNSLQKFPQLLISAVQQNHTKTKASSDEWRHIFQGVYERVEGRNYNGTKVIGKLLDIFYWGLNKDKEILPYVWDCAVVWNKRNKPPLEEKELRTIFESIVTKHYGTREH